MSVGPFPYDHFPASADAASTKNAPATSASPTTFDFTGHPRGSTARLDSSGDPPERAYSAGLSFARNHGRAKTPGSSIPVPSTADTLSCGGVPHHHRAVP